MNSKSPAMDSPKGSVPTAKPGLFAEAQQFEQQRKQAAFAAMMKLLEHGAANEQQLAVMTAPLSQEEMVQVAEERALADKCGNPTCTKPFNYKAANAKYVATPDGVAKSAACHFCSPQCSNFITQFAARLGNPLDRLRPEVRAQLQAASHKPRAGSAGDLAAHVGGVPTMLANIQERHPAQVNTSFPSSGTAGVVDGYQPGRSRSQPETPVGLHPVFRDGDDDDPLPVRSLSRSSTANSSSSSFRGWKSAGRSSMRTSSSRSRRNSDSGAKLHVGFVAAEVAVVESTEPEEEPQLNAIPEDESGVSSTGSGSSRPRILEDEIEEVAAGMELGVVLKDPTAPDEPVLLARSESTRERVLLKSPSGRDKAEGLRKSTSMGRRPTLTDTVDLSTSEGRALGAIVRSRSMSMRESSWDYELKESPEPSQARGADASTGQDDATTLPVTKADTKVDEASCQSEASAATDLSVPLQQGHVQAQQAEVDAPSIVSHSEQMLTSQAAASPSATGGTDHGSAGTAEEPEVSSSSPTPATSEAAATATKPAVARKFKPQAPPRRKVIMLDSPPPPSASGAALPVVIVKRIPPPGKAGGGAAAEAKDSQQPSSDTGADAAQQQQQLGKVDGDVVGDAQHGRDGGVATTADASAAHPLAQAAFAAATEADRLEHRPREMPPEVLPFESAESTAPAATGGSASGRPHVVRIGGDRQAAGSTWGSQPVDYSSVVTRDDLDDDEDDGEYSNEEDWEEQACGDEDGELGTVWEEGAEDEEEGDGEEGREEEGEGDGSDSRAKQRGRSGGSRSRRAQDAEGDAQSDSASAGAPFLSKPPKGFTVELSRFNTVWSTLSGWVSAATVEYLNLDPARARSGVEEIALPVPSMQSVQARSTLMAVLDREVAVVVDALGIKVAVNDIGRRLAAVLCTMRFEGPLPSIKPHDAELILAAILAALSKTHLPALQDVFPVSRAADRSDGPEGRLLFRLDLWLDAIGYDYRQLMALVELLTCADL